MLSSAVLCASNSDFVDASSDLRVSISCAYRCAAFRNSSRSAANFDSHSARVRPVASSMSALLAPSSPFTADARRSDCTRSTRSASTAAASSFFAVSVSSLASTASRLYASHLMDASRRASANSLSKFSRIVSLARLLVSVSIPPVVVVAGGRSAFNGDALALPERLPPTLARSNFCLKSSNFPFKSVVSRLNRSVFALCVDRSSSNARPIFVGDAVGVVRVDANDIDPPRTPPASTPSYARLRLSSSLNNLRLAKTLARSASARRNASRRSSSSHVNAFRSRPRSAPNTSAARIANQSINEWKTNRIKKVLSNCTARVYYVLATTKPTNRSTSRPKCMRIRPRRLRAR